VTVPIIGAKEVLDEWTGGDGLRWRLVRGSNGVFGVELYSGLSLSWQAHHEEGHEAAQRLGERTEELRLDRQRIVLFAAALARSIGLAETLSFEAPSGFTRLAQRHHEALLRVAVAVGLPLERWKVKVPEGLTPDPETAEVARRLGIEIQERRAQ
jgi:hypothetical protein